MHLKCKVAGYSYEGHDFNEFTVRFKLVAQVRRLTPLGFAFREHWVNLLHLFKCNAILNLSSDTQEVSVSDVRTSVMFSTFLENFIHPPQPHPTGRYQYSTTFIWQCELQVTRTSYDYNKSYASCPVKTMYLQRHCLWMFVVIWGINCSFMGWENPPTS